jgi:predicted oxidoreductase
VAGGDKASAVIRASVPGHLESALPDLKLSANLPERLLETAEHREKVNRQKTGKLKGARKSDFHQVKARLLETALPALIIWNQAHAPTARNKA